MRRPRFETGAAGTKSLDAALAEAQRKVDVLKRTARDVKAQLKEAKKAARRAKKAVRRARKTEIPSDGAVPEVTPAQTSSTKTRPTITPVKAKPVKKAKTGKPVQAVVKTVKTVSKMKSTRSGKKRTPPLTGGRRRTIANPPPPDQAPAMESILPEANRAADWNQDEWSADLSVKSE